MTMMRQFEITNYRGRRYLALIDTSRWEYWWGFTRLVKELP